MSITNGLTTLPKSLNRLAAKIRFPFVVFIAISSYACAPPDRQDQTSAPRSSTGSSSPPAEVEGAMHFLYTPEDPLVLANGERLETIIWRLATQENVELLLGGGVASTSDPSKVVYMVLPASFPIATDTLDSVCVNRVIVDYDDQRNVRAVRIMDQSRTGLMGPKMPSFWVEAQ